MSSEATRIVLLSRRCSLESTCDDLATTLDASEAGERSDLGWLASPLFPRERETSANPFGMYHSNTEGSEAPFSHLQTGIEQSTARSRTKRKSIRGLGVVRDSHKEKDKILLTSKRYIISLKGKLIKPSES